MTIEDMKYALKYNTIYFGDKWFDKVDKMHDNQVIAIYNKMIQNGDIRE